MPNGTTKTVDFTWNMNTGELRFFGRSKVILEHFLELFEKTFAVIRGLQGLLDFPVRIPANAALLVTEAGGYKLVP